jgi:cytochrome c biogenesis protein
MKKPSASRAFVELMSSMRFAISLLTILAIASIIGTVLKQNDAYNAYLNQFGPFWFPIFEKLGLYAVYNAGWFLAILAFLVASTSICIVRQFRPMMKEMRAFKEHARETSLRLFKHHAEFQAADFETARNRVAAYLDKAGFQRRDNPRDDGVLIAAKRGAWSRWGYFLAHGGLVVICLGGLLDGNLPLKAQMAFGGKKPTHGDQLIADIPATSRLGVENWSYRGNIFIPEGRTSDQAVVNIDDGLLLQQLPFTVSLKKFHIDHYETGQPKRFASDIVLTDKRTGKSVARTIEVNKPFEYDGITLYQASFDDGGSKLSMRAWPMAGGAPSKIEGEVGSRAKLAGSDYTVEYTDFRPFNIENVAEGGTQKPEGALARFGEHLGSAAKPADRRDFRNLGPTIQYKLRDSAGQAREFLNYMQPMQQDNRWFVLAGMRESQADGFRYMRIPVDEDGRVDSFFGIRTVLLDPKRQPLLARRFAQAAGGSEISADARAKLEETTLRTLQIFTKRGFESLGSFIETSIPKDERERAADIFLQVLEGVVWQAWTVSREDQHLAPLATEMSHGPFVRDTLNAVSDSLHYAAPVYLQLDQFQQVQATVLQATRSPGKKWVYLGSLLLVLGVFAMLYVRERRLFVLLKRDGTALVALSSNRVSLDVEREFAQHREALQQALTMPAQVS